MSNEFFLLNYEDEEDLNKINIIEHKNYEKELNDDFFLLDQEEDNKY
jgi:hypothetical protein